MSINNIKNKKVGYLRVSQCIPLSQNGSGTIGGYTQRMAILKLLDDAGCSITFLSEVLKDDLYILEKKGWEYEPLLLDLKDKFEILIVENATTHNLFFSSMYKDLPSWFSEDSKLPLIQVQDRRVASFRGERIYWQCLDPMLLRALWSSLEDQERLGKITTVWHGALNESPYIEKLQKRVHLFKHCNDYRFFSAKRFNRYLPINPIEKRSLDILYMGSKKPRMKVLKDIYFSDKLKNYNVNIVGKWPNDIVEQSPQNVKWWEPIPQWDALSLHNMAIATIIIMDIVYEKSSWWTTRSLEGIYGNCIMMVSDRVLNPEKFVFDKRLIVNGNTVGDAFEWIKNQNYIELIMKQRNYFKSKWYVSPEDEFSMF